MANSQELADIILNRQAVALARSRRLVQSWLPQKPTTADEELPNPQPTAGEEDDDWEGMTELQGVGSKRKAEDEGVLDGLKRKKLSSDNKLLELLLGKKAAQSRKKTLEAMPQQWDASEDEEEGRAALFKSRKSKAKPAVVELEPEVDRPKDPAADEDGMDAKSQVQVRPAREEAPPPAKKRKGGSYLDEILNQKAAKQGKKKKKQHKTDAAEA
ncbi:hypothetical protein LTR35_003247 [Friedmanniomyces endolithicus]|uniref:Uncharacterized protein n=1 Tax=Friedmanniomyces endolithicus TaxID=329885 RepID=A0AAN6JCK2_9PEZI|nr:hypothetical protein LTS09_012171 [Friedmanniomyces endolithicus]KAK0288848.1 hypothetical protein LTR35_003247 [Friedmanniomyces endolithicus]KAK0293104.1 hypothetical protein LTS00_007705 [Friedmanniomyces endolithicus]KAK0316488.1 hypothetical protein LTR01_000236 [Friedmanniomyces endolithicus]KAK0319439.1 hypothetical protein LTR82_009504 [Friedmanniomyces endolithicus]